MEYITLRDKPMSYTQFVALHKTKAREWCPWHRWIPQSIRRGDWYNVAFALRFRVPDGQGFFGKGCGRWCWPWQFYRFYYAARFPNIAKTLDNH